MKIIYENDDGGISVVSPAPKESWVFVNVSKGLDIDPRDSAFVIAVKKARKAAIDKLLRIVTKHTPTEDEWLNFIVEHDIPAGKPFEIIEDSEIPTDRTFRDAWKKDAKKVSVDMPKARNIHMDRIREEREKKLKEIDIDINKREDTGIDTTDMRKKRQDLRDIPQKFVLSGYKTPDELKVAWPNGLKK